MHAMRQTRIAFATILLAGFGASSALASEWSDTSLGYRYGTKFGEPYGSNDITKNILDLQHVSGYKYGINFFNVDMLLSDSKDPASVGSTSGAYEVYVVYRNTLDLGKVTGGNYKFGPVRGIGITAGFDMNAKADAGYNSKKRMLVLGPTLMFDVPGFLNASLLELWESNAPYNGYSGTGVPRYSYKAHPMLSFAWGIPFSLGIPLSFEGYCNFIASKGKNEFGGDTKPETNFDAEVMYDMSGAFGAGKNTFKVGFEYQYWKNKFGNDHSGYAGSGAFAKTPMIRLEYHF
jgi:nucleoside-specific outer membrane channel protein Tsx